MTEPKNMRNAVSRFGRDTRGAIAVMTALLLPVLIGIAAYAVDASLLLYRQERLQIATDIGARAGAEMLARGESDTRAIVFAQTMVAANIGTNGGAAPTIDVTMPETGRLSVEASLPVARIFSQLFGDGAVIVRAGSVAMYEMGAEPTFCIYLDDPDAKQSLRLRNRSFLSLAGCGIAVASDDRNNAVQLSGGAGLKADCVDVAGGISGADDIETTRCDAPRAGVVVPVPADFASLPDAPRREVGCSDWESDDDDKKGKGKGTEDGGSPETASLTPGPPLLFGLPQICLSEMTVDIDTVGGPGIYFIEDELKIEDGATLTLGPGAVIVLLRDAEINMDDDATLAMAAPDTGPLTGVAIMQGRDRIAPTEREHEIGRIAIEGRIALSKEAIEITGQSTATRCTRILSGTLEFANRAELEISCPETSATGRGTVSLAPSQ
jgi:hypothetical protein